VGHDTKQTTLDGVFVPALPKVRTTRGYLLDWDRDRIVRQILEETKLVEVFYGYKGADEKAAQEIARTVEQRILWLGLKSLSGALIREIVNITLLERAMVQYRNVCTRVGTPVYDAHLIDVGRGFEAKDNANLQENAETSHKKKADKISKEQYLLQLPPDLADHHLGGDLHIHDLEYFGTRPFCIDGSTVIPVRTGNRIRSIRPDELPIEGDWWCPQDLSALTPKGWRRVAKVTRREVGQDEMIRIRTSGGRTVLVTGEHRIPVRTESGMAIRRADEVQAGDILYRISTTDPVRGEAIRAIDLVRELPASVPTHLLENVYVRGAREIFANAVRTGQVPSFSDISRELGVEHQKQWYSRGIMPVALFNAFCSRYGIEDYAGVTLGVTGSEHELPAILMLTPELIRLLGFFVAEGNYNAAPAVGQYNLAITENCQAHAIKASAHATLNTFATIAGGTFGTTTIYGVEVERNRALQVYFGGKLVYLLFRHVFGVPEGAAGKRLPWIVYHLDDLLLHEFLSALFTGDGSAYYRPKKSDCIVNYTTASPALRQELSLLLTTLGMTPHIVELYGEEEERRTLYRVQLNGRKNIEAFARYATFLDNRQDHIDSFLSAVKERQAGEREESVTGVCPAEPTGAYVYDLFLDGDGTEESHTFFASDGLLIHNCQDWDLRYFFYYGLMPDGNGTKASVAGPAKRAEVAVLHAVKALGSAQTNFAGGQGYYNFLTFIAPFFEGMAYDEIRQLMQMFVYEMTQMMVARGGQVVFSSVQLSPGVPALWKDKPCVYRGKVWDGKQAPLRTYGEFEREVRLLFKALMEVMLEGDYWGKPFSFPKPEISIEPDFMNENEEFNREHPDIPTYQDLYLLTFELASKFGTPYYDNQIPPYRGAGEGISCYQCLAGDELVPVVGSDGRTRVTQIQDLFNEAARTGMRVDPFGTEFACLEAQTPSADLTAMTASLRPFRGVMRQKYAGEMLKITLDSGRQITVTPDHPVFTLEKGAFNKQTARALRPGDYMPVLRTIDLYSKSEQEICAATIQASGHTSEVTLRRSKQVNDGDVRPVRVRSVERIPYEGHVYDLVDVAETHTFSNALGIVTGNCCAYQFSSVAEKDDQFENKLYFKDGKHFSMGSWQVMSINCPRASYRADGSQERLFAELKSLMDVAVELFHIKRRWMSLIRANGRMPFAMQRPKDPNTGERGAVAVDLEDLVYTIGVVGVNEMVQHFTGHQLHESKEAFVLAVRALTELELYAAELSKRHNMTIALARTPAETTGQRFAVADLLDENFREHAKKVIKGDLTSALKMLGKTLDLPIYYTNGTHVTPAAPVPLTKRIEVEHVFFPIVDGGNIFHIWLGEARPDPRGLMDMAMRLCRNTQIGYFAFTRDITVSLKEFQEYKPTGSKESPPEAWKPGEGRLPA